MGSVSDASGRMFLQFFGLLFLCFLLAGCSAGPGEVFISGSATQSSRGDHSMAYRQLTPQEKAVIVDKGTEAPFTGLYYKTTEPGLYRCRRCDAPLFRSEDKFESGCGWPSFDDAIAGAVRQLPDADGRRTEIVCSACGAHLGHLFLGERLTKKDARFCVNSVSLDFEPAEKPAPAAAKAVFAGGCFWGVEYYFRALPGVLSTKVGYTGGTTRNPTYREVCEGGTGHAEAIEITFDPAVISYETLATRFFEIHDPSQLNRQGPDIGVQYRSAVFYQDEGQKRTIEALIARLKENGYPVVTAVVPAVQFWPAEEYHQNYYGKNGHQPYCHSLRKRF